MTARKTASPELTPAEMKAALQAEQQKRVQTASEAIQAICEKHKVQIVPQCTLTQGHVAMSLSIVPTE